MSNPYNEIEYKRDIKSLEKVTHSRLLSINKIIRLNRNKMTKDSLDYYKQKRKETDILLSNIKNIDGNFHELKDRYLTFEIEDPRFL